MSVACRSRYTAACLSAAKLVLWRSSAQAIGMSLAASATTTSALVAQQQRRHGVEQAAAALRHHDPALEQDGCASLLSAANCIVGRVAASAMASMSRSSFFCALT